jgi:hypothetical protein
LTGQTPVLDGGGLILTGRLRFQGRRLRFQARRVQIQGGRLRQNETRADAEAQGQTGTTGAGVGGSPEQHEEGGKRVKGIKLKQ